ncbi:DUF2797 domain-containing protein [Nocardia sp. NPDC058176]|uniref:DUF2797 domain-containing protein n=1 Tax=Nocardia sp. NPDC058176 TaxID=3346368 RepID=UPI0036DEA476
MGARLAFTVSGAGRFCTGRSAFDRAGNGRFHDCDGRRPALTGRQCAECATADEFRFIHHAHRGGYLPAGLRAYVAQPHWVYIATFADASNKVGTAVHPRRRVRLDEQGAIRATYLAWADTGVTARVYEDLISSELGVVQAKRRSAKLAALVRPRPTAQIEDAHGRAVEVARELLAKSSAVLPLEPWRPPAEHAGFAGAAGRTDTVEYPHSLTSGDHCLSVAAMVGSAALVSVNEDEGLFVADLGALAGRRLVPGPVRSPQISTQLGLF